MKKSKDKKRRYGWIIALAMVVVAVGFVAWMALNAACIHLRRATVTLPDLPPAFEGRTILYVSDIDLGGINSSKRAAAVFDRLQVLMPDILLLGGDYTAPTLMDLLNQSRLEDYAANRADLRRDFFYYIRDFRTTLGKYMLAAPDDLMTGDLTSLAEETGFILLQDKAAELSLGNDRIWLVGLNGGGLSHLAGQFRKSDCVIAAAYSPSLLPAAMITEASDSGHWVDLALSGHTHGGQIRLFGRSILSLDTVEQQFLSGWSRETGVPILVTSGMGCEGVNLRLNSQPEVWLITLTRGNQE